MEKWTIKMYYTAISCCSWFGWFPVCGCRSAYCLPCPTWWWPSLCPSAASWPTTYAARTSWRLPLSGKSWTVEVRSLNWGWNIIFHTSRCTAPGCYFHGVRSILLSRSVALHCQMGLRDARVYVFVKIYLLNTQVDSLIVTVHWFHICHLRNWVQTMYHA